MAFPVSPVDGDIYNELMWNATVGAWVDIPKQIISGRVGDNSSPVGLIAFSVFWTDEGSIVYDAGTKRFTVGIDGTYRITLNPFFNTSGTARVTIGVNTDAPTAGTAIGMAYRATASYDTGCLNTVYDFSAGDYIVYFVNEGSLYAAVNDDFTQFSIERIG